MAYHSHTLNSNHSHIIGRTDPITGDSVKENDSVVFCANCQSCFLEESWIYMNEKHCEQNQTLETAPTLPSKLIAKKTKEEIIAEFKDTKINSTVYTLTGLSFISSFIGLATSDPFFASEIGATFFVSLFVALLIGFVSFMITSTNKVKEFIGESQNDVRIFRNRIEIGKETFLWNDIEQIKYQREMYIYASSHKAQNFSYTPFLLIYLKEGGVIKQDLASKNYKKSEEFLIGLEKISHFVEIFLYSENSKELEVMRNIKYRSKGNIQIGRPRKSRILIE